MDKDNYFQYIANPKFDNVAKLQAVMSDFTYSKHAHEEFSLGVTLQGRQDFFCHDAYYKSPQGGVMVFNPDDIHDGHSGAEQNLEYVMLYVHPDEFAPAFHSMDIKNLNDVRVQNRLIDDAVLRQQIIELSHLIEHKNFSQIEYEHGVYQLAQSLAKHSEKNEHTINTTRIDTLLHRAKEFIHANLAVDISIDDIAHAASISKYHFIRLFRSQFGITPHQYVLNCRINLARRYLDQGWSTTQSAQLAGFADISHLNRRFKRVYGMTPKQYQLQRLPNSTN